MQSLGTLATKDGLIVLAGVNSSEKDQEAGKNEHLRAFDVKYPPRKKQKTEASEKASENDKGEWKLLGKRSLFRPANDVKKEQYQRLLRLSPAKMRETGSKRIGAIATGLAKKNSQLIVFNATNPAPADADILTRIDLDEGREGQEANDLDVTTLEENEFSFVFCTDDGIHEQTFKYDFTSKNTDKIPKGPRRVSLMPFPDTLEDPKSRPKFRCVRFLNSQNVVSLVNKPNKGGAELRLFHFYPTGPAILVGEKKLPARIKQGASMDVCALDADKEGNQQFVIAVAGSDISIEIFTTNYNPRTSTFSNLRSYITIRNVHQHQMTKLCFTPYHGPARNPEVRQDKGKVYIAGPQYIRLASVSFGNTVVVDTFPLTPMLPNKLRESRYVLSHPSDETWAKYTYIFVISLIVIVVAFLIQSFRTGFGDDVGPFQYLPESWREMLDMPVGAAYGKKYVKVGTGVQQVVTADATATGRLQSIMDRHDIPIPSAIAPVVADPDMSTPDTACDTPSASSEVTPEKEKILVLRPGPEAMGGVTIDVHPDKAGLLEKDEEAKHWDELHEHEKSWWKDRLQRAGQWAEAEGEGVLTGILFSEFAGAVAGGVGEMLQG